MPVQNTETCAEKVDAQKTQAKPSLSLDKTIEAVAQKRKVKALKDHKKAKASAARQKSQAHVQRVLAGKEKFDAVDSSDSDFVLDEKVKAKKK